MQTIQLLGDLLLSIIFQIHVNLQHSKLEHDPKKGHEKNLLNGPQNSVSFHI